MIEWLCTQERWSPGVAIKFDAAVRYRQAIVGSRHNDAHPGNSALLHIAPFGLWQFAGVQNDASFFLNFVGVCFSCWG
jgi:hypothetical protein